MAENQHVSHPVATVPDPHHKIEGDDMWGSNVTKWEQAIEGWTAALQAEKHSAITVYQRRWQLRTLAQRYARRSPWKLTTADLHAWINNPSWGKDSAKSARSGARSFYAWAVEAKLTKRNPAQALKPVKVGKRLPRPVRAQIYELARVRADARVRMMLALAYHGGLRASEIARLRWDDVDDRHMWLTGKGDVVRRMPIHRELKPELDAYRQVCQDRVWLFPSRRTGHGIHPRYVSALLSEALGEGVTGHQLRHAFATRVLSKTGNLAAAQKLLGHASPETTKIYADVSDDALDDVIEAI